ncbi:hypothetical protein LCGC14_0292600 [marine sediment metagenome]|uniref:Uncharacterized protein n=1 Tax=marine sediment metagenome TaxID=412755 RepID=A0A0F9WYE0_9ZZZZ|nr:hypothetical protein [Maribacter sp.]HDZ06747.1 hypothetical protein [Maribacter sp.]HEA79367.1 hypothetical protein [Maribacter sp.]
MTNSIKLKTISLLFPSFLCLFIGWNEVYSQKKSTPEIYLNPIFKVNYSDATADKPQSKSWTNDYGQWLIVGDEDGPKLLKKDSLGWTSQSTINQVWHNLPSRADVLAEGNDAHIVFVSECALNVVRITYSQEHEAYKNIWKANLPIPKECQSIETATITKDSKNQFWVCADMNEKIMVWHSFNGSDWSNPFTVADDINIDDISLIVSLKKQVSVIWSNQNTETMNEVIHFDGDPISKWSIPITIQKGDNNADDHLNATVFKNGKLAMVTKNSVDKINQPQFVLRLRDKKGKWTNIPYENLNSELSPSRPIINHIQSGRIFEIHSVKNKVSKLYYISVNEIISKKGHWQFKELIQLKTKIDGKNGDTTSSKASFTVDQVKLIFFSDNLGNIYSFDLDTLL